MSKKVKVEVSTRKAELANETAAKLVTALEKDIPAPLMVGFVELFMSMQSKTLERFQGLLVGVPLNS